MAELAVQHTSQNSGGAGGFPPGPLTGSRWLGLVHPDAVEFGSLLLVVLVSVVPL
jgi:hypothetical protein